MIEWQKSSFSGGADGNSCIELAQDAGTSLLRESDDPERILNAAPAALAALLHRMRVTAPEIVKSRTF